MKFLNEDHILANGTGVYTKLRRDALKMLESALDSVDPKESIYNKVKVEEDKLTIEDKMYDLDRFKRVYLVGGGKAGGSMAEAIESLLGDRLTGGIVNILQGTEGKYHLRRVKLVGASHPVPNEAGVRGVAQMLSMVSGLTSRDLVIVIISGGGSALMPSPAEGITLDDMQAITERLLKKGVTINDLNAVRKHLDSFKGGQLAQRCQPANVLSLILSDVVGDPLDTIASGPTAPDSTTWVDAENVLRKYDSWKDAPEPIRRRVEKGVMGEIPETPKSNDQAFSKIYNVLVANNSYAAEAASKKATELGYNSMILSTMVEGEARQVGSVYAGIAREVASRSRPISAPAAIIIGGETTVDVKGSGNGGRNQEVALGATKRIAGTPCLVASLATDGIDGPTDSAGAIVDGATLKRITKLNLSIDATLRENDAYHLFEKVEDLLITGPTGTNVNDLALILVAGEWRDAHS
ncbi:MAG: glycerate kinase [Candidatus Bathyarchaeia archaeon]